MKLTIIGASGQGKVVADIAEKNGYDEIDFLDDDETIMHCGKWPVVGPSMKAMEIEHDLFVAIGDASIREALMLCFQDKYFPVLIHPGAIVAEDVEIGEGTVVMAGAVINPGARIGRSCIINTCASVDHDCKLGDFSHVAVGAHLSGTVTLGKGSWIAVGASVVNNVTICDGCTVGAGAVVLHDITEPGTYVGIPVHRLMKK